MNPERLRKPDRVREKALARGVPPGEAERGPPPPARARPSSRSRHLLGTSRLQLDGYSTDPYGETDLVICAAWREADRTGRPPRIEAWALLAQWCGGAHVGGDVHWTITRQNAVERRFG
ncbi:hypothetical protein [Streptomyces sp. NPDC000931]|uniref:hypothetical protein n=1 Tax=Streptomyces sp. NPDC000931 TaxID=3154372 RepID=UPI00331806BF